MTIYDYARLSAKEKGNTIKYQALFLESYKDEEKTIYVYFMDDFFIEVARKNEEVIDYLPYKRGFRIEKQSL